MSYSVGILIYDGVDLQQIAAPFHLLAHAALAERPNSSLFTIHTVARTKEIVTCFGGVQILPDHIYPDAKIYDIILIPGGPGYQEALKNLRLMNWINQASRLAEVVAAIETGVYLLAAARLLNGRTAAAVSGLAEAYSGVEVAVDEVVVQSDKILTVASHHHGQALAQAIIKEVEGDAGLHFTTSL